MTNEPTVSKVQSEKRKRIDYKAKYFTARAYAIFFACTTAVVLIYYIWRAH